MGPEIFGCPPIIRADGYAGVRKVQVFAAFGNGQSRSMRPAAAAIHAPMPKAAAGPLAIQSTPAPALAANVATPMATQGNISGYCWYFTPALVPEELGGGKYEYSDQHHRQSSTPHSADCRRAPPNQKHQRPLISQWPVPTTRATPREPLRCADQAAEVRSKVKAVARRIGSVEPRSGRHLKPDA
jgi:hypothetical protein